MLLFVLKKILRILFVFAFYYYCYYCYHDFIDITIVTIIIHIFIIIGGNYWLLLLILVTHICMAIGKIV